MPIGYKPPKVEKNKPKPPIVDFPFPVLPTGIKPIGPSDKPELPQPARRMAGILVSDKIYAIIETNGQSEIVQPGDTLKDRLAVVQKIERDKVLLKTKDEKPRYILVRMAASPKQGAGLDSGPASINETDAGPMRPYSRPGGGRRPRAGDPTDDFN